MPFMPLFDWQNWVTIRYKGAVPTVKTNCTLYNKYRDPLKRVFKTLLTVVVTIFKRFSMGRVDLVACKYVPLDGWWWIRSNQITRRRRERRWGALWKHHRYFKPTINRCPKCPTPFHSVSNLNLNTESIDKERRERERERKTWRWRECTHPTADKRPPPLEVNVCLPQKRKKRAKMKCKRAEREFSLKVLGKVGCSAG